MAAEQLYCVVDIGGTKILVMIIDQNRNVLFRDKFNTPEEATPEGVVNSVRERLNSFYPDHNYDPESLKGLGICVAAFVNHEKGEIYHAPNISWHNVPLKALFEDSFSDSRCSVYLENDATAAVAGEVAFGAAGGHLNVIYVTLSTGIGGGLYLNGRLYRGSTGFAGEVGHTKPFGKGRTCSCSGEDCLEIWASGSAIAASAAILWPEGLKGREKLTTAQVFEEADGGNPLAARIIEEAAHKSATGLANLVTLFNPSCLVVGGGVAANRPEYLEKVFSLVRQQAIEPSVRGTGLLLEAARLKSDSGAWGMYALMTGEVEG